MRVIEKISWMPYRLMCKIKKSDENPIHIDLNKIGVNKKFILYLSKEDSGLSTQLRTFGFREPLNTKHYYNFINSSDKILDIGSNIGVFTILSEKAKQIVCIEPLKQAIFLFEKNIEKNKLSKKTKIINAAIGKKGKLLIEICPQLNLSKIVAKKNKNTEEIESIPLKDLVEKYNSNFLKLDVEGYEYEILHKKIPKKINKISMEFHTQLLGEKKVRELLLYFEKEEFKVKYLIEDLPLRLYPFYNLFKKIGLIKCFTYVKKNLSPNECLSYANKGRKLKYLFLKR
jgi:FkbM family methyltransferase